MFFMPCEYARSKDRQTKSKGKGFKLVVEDKCSGAVPFFTKQGGMEIKRLIEQKVKSTLSVLTIDRLGRDLRDIINTIHFYTENKTTIHFISQGLPTLDPKGRENPIAKMMISILGIVGEMEKTQIKERQIEGINPAKRKGVYKGRLGGSKEDTLKFLGKEQNKKNLEYLKKGYKAVEISKITGVHINTITKIKKLGMKSID